MGGEFPAIAMSRQPPSYQNVSLRLGPTKTLPAGAAAQVVNTGPPHAPTLEFHIPAGAPGKITSFKAKLLPPGALPTIENKGTDTAAAITLGIPQGQTGPQGKTGNVGPEGPPGIAATINIGTVTVGPAGGKITVVNSGTKTNAVLDFSFPMNMVMQA